MEMEMKMEVNNSELKSMKIAAQIIQVLAVIKDTYPDIAEEYEIDASDLDIPVPELKDVKTTEDAMKYLAKFIPKSDIKYIGNVSLVKDIERRGYDTNLTKLAEYVCYWMDLDNIDEFYEEGITGKDLAKLVNSKLTD